MSALCYVCPLLRLPSVMSALCYVRRLLCLPFVMSSVCHGRRLLFPPFVVSSVCLSRVWRTTNTTYKHKHIYGDSYTQPKTNIINRSNKSPFPEKGRTQEGVMFDKNHLMNYYLQNLKECSHISITMTNYTFFLNWYTIMSFLYSKTLPHEKKKTAAFGQDICNTHEYKCTHMMIRIFFLEIIITLLRYWFGRCQRHITQNFTRKQKRSLIYG